MFLYEVFDAAKQLNGSNFFSAQTKSADYIIKNLNPKIALRSYQEEAIGRLIHYSTGYPGAKKPTHLLFNMATGSGKTVILAATILHYASLGYKNFLFTTRLGSIVEKTLDNLLRGESSKYLFDSTVTIANIDHTLRRVKNFSSDAGGNVLSIYAETTSFLHSSLNNVSEASISIDDFKDKKIVILADEAHNLSGQTLSKVDEEIETRNWEKTVERIHKAHPENVLIEYTATARIEGGNPAIIAKYQDSLIYKYALKEMRNEGFSKNVSTLQLDAPLHLRVLSALVISAYRESRAAQMGVSLKPVIMFKANRIRQSDQVITRDTTNPTFVGSQNFQDFFQKYIGSLTPDDFSELNSIASGQILHALESLAPQAAFETLPSLFKDLFTGNKFLSVDDAKEKRDVYSLLNSLEDVRNPVRVVLATEKLNEGWDVLNLFDIVRLYDSRDAKGNKAGKNTILEAQLIGRGARYYSFTMPDGSNSPTRRYDNDSANDEGILEQLYYHSMRNTRYIQELEQVLVEQGVIAESSIQRNLFVKETTKSLALWKEISIFRNELISVDEIKPDMREAKLPERCRVVHVSMHTFETVEKSVFSSVDEVDNGVVRETLEVDPKSIDFSIWLAALDHSSYGSYDSLAHYLPGLNSRQEFIESPNYLSGVTITVTSSASNLSQFSRAEFYVLATKVIEEILSRLVKTDRIGLGTKKFKPVSLEDVFGSSKVLNFDPSNPRAIGRSDIQFNELDWYAQNEAWGTDQEYSLIQYVQSQIPKLRNVWSEILLVRNEGHMSIYDFDSGQRFNPDFLLIVARKMKDGAREVKQIFLEPKGDQFLDSNNEFTSGSEGWKESLLIQIKSVGQIDHDLIQTTRIAGLPLYNNGHLNPHLNQKFRKEFEELLEVS